MTNKIVIYEARMAKIFVLSPVWITCYDVTGVILDEFRKGNIIISICVKILGSKGSHNYFSNVSAKVTILSDEFVFKGREEAMQRFPNKDKFKNVSSRSDFSFSLYSLRRRHKPGR